MKTYIATVHLVVRVEDDQAPEDDISSLLSEEAIRTIEKSTEARPGLLDWSYMRHGSRQSLGYSYPMQIPGKYIERDGSDHHQDAVKYGALRFWKETT